MAVTGDETQGSVDAMPTPRQGPPCTATPGRPPTAATHRGLRSTWPNGIGRAFLILAVAARALAATDDAGAGGSAGTARHAVVRRAGQFTTDQGLPSRPVRTPGDGAAFASALGRAASTGTAWSAP